MKILNIITLFAALIFGCKTSQPVTNSFPLPCVTVSEITKVDTVVEIVEMPEYVDRIVTKEVEGKTVTRTVRDTVYTEKRDTVIRKTTTREVESVALRKQYDSLTNTLSYCQYQRDSLLKALNTYAKENDDLNAKYNRSLGGGRTKTILIGSLSLLLLLLVALGVWGASKLRVRM